VTWLNDNAVQVTVPDGEGKALDSRITIAAQSSVLASSFSYDPPAITALIYTNTDTDGGNTVTVLGYNFGSVAAAQSGAIGSTSAPVTYTSHIVSLLTTPAGTGKDLPVNIVISGQQGSYSGCGKPSCAFSYTAPSITHVTPKYGAAAGGSSITIYGANFGQGVASETAASIHTLPCASITFVSSSQLVCAAAANSLNVNGTGACSECNAHAVTALVDINGLQGFLMKAFSYSNDGSTAALAALWCSAVKVAFSSNSNGMIYIDPDSDGDTSDAYQVFCRQQADGGGWTKIVQYEEDAYTPTLGAFGMVATQEIFDGKLSDAEIALIGGRRALVNTGSVIPSSDTAFSLRDDFTDELPLSRAPSRYVGLSITIGSESRVITSYSVTGTNPSVVVSPAFTLAPASGATYQIYSPSKEYHVFGTSFTGQTDDAEEPIYKLYLRSSFQYVDTSYGQGILSDTSAAVGACVAGAYADCPSSWTYFVSPGYIDTMQFGLPANSPGALDDCDRIITDLDPNFCLGHFYDSITFVQASQTQRCYISGACGVGQTIGKGVRLLQVSIFTREYDPDP